MVPPKEDRGAVLCPLGCRDRLHGRRLGSGPNGVGGGAATGQSHEVCRVGLVITPSRPARELKQTNQRSNLNGQEHLADLFANTF